MQGDSAGSYRDAQLAAIVDSSSDAIISKNLEGEIQSWNRSAERLFGWSADEMIGQSVRRLIPEDRQAEEDMILAQVRNGDIVPKFETVRLTRSGEAIPVAITVSPIRSSSGEIVGASKIANDLREQTSLRDQLEAGQRQFEALAQNIPQLAWMADANGWIYWYNNRWYDYTGTTLEEMQGWGWKAVHHPDHIERVVERFQHSLDMGEDWEDTFPLRGRDGQFRWFLSRANTLRDEDGKVILWCGTNTDITEQREANERISLLVDEVNHRARNMLATIQAIISRTLARKEPDLVERLSRRIAALSSNQELLTTQDWSGAHVTDIVRAQISHVVELDSSRVSLTGPEKLLLKPAAAEALGLAIHELATNAAKYGALSVAEGHVDVTWEISEDGETPSFEIKWHERGGPPVSTPTRTGFGTIIIKRNPEHATRGTVALDYLPDGVVWTLSAPVENNIVQMA